jgi:hypothetical protein
LVPARLGYDNKVYPVCLSWDWDSFVIELGQIGGKMESKMGPAIIARAISGLRASVAMSSATSVEMVFEGEVWSRSSGSD